MKRGVILIAVSLSINIFLVAANGPVYATSPIGVIIWGALAYGIFLIGRDVYQRFK